MSTKKIKKTLLEKCPKCQATNFAIGKNIDLIRYCTFSKEDGYNGRGEKGCGAIWKPLTADQISLEALRGQHRLSLEALASIVDLLSEGNANDDTLFASEVNLKGINHNIDIIREALS